MSNTGTGTNPTVVLRRPEALPRPVQERSHVQGWDAARVQLPSRLRPSPPADSAVFCPQEGARGFRCLCAAGFVGTHCEIQRNQCASQPCQNGGLCHTVLDGFVCQCPPEFAGQLCEVSCGSFFKKIFLRWTLDFKNSFKIRCLLKQL